MEAGNSFVLLIYSEICYIGQEAYALTQVPHGMYMHGQPKGGSVGKSRTRSKALQTPTPFSIVRLLHFRFSPA